jgi:hypothetical protein
MSLKTELIQNPRENSGSKSANRFDYQKNWALCKILELHLSGKNYLLVLDFHEDVLVLDSETDPTKIQFYQIKTTQQGHWTLTQLLGQKEGKRSKKLPSKIGKLYSNKIKFPDTSKSFHFVSNGYFKVKLNSNKNPYDCNSICINQLDKKQKDNFCSKLAKELKIKKTDVNQQIIFLEITDLSLRSHNDHAQGKLVEFLNKIRPQRKYAVQVIYNVLFDEIKRRTDYEQQITSFDECKNKKSICKSSFDKILEEIEPTISMDKIWEELSPQLSTEGWEIKEKLKLKENWDKYEIERMNKTNIILQLLKKKIIKIIEEEKDKKFSNLRNKIQSITKKYIQIKNPEERIYSKDYLNAVILMEYCQDGK